VNPLSQETDFGKAVADPFLRGWKFPSLFSTGYPADAAAHAPGPAAAQARMALPLLLNIFGVTHVC